jgi:hypothetical protein
MAHVLVAICFANAGTEALAKIELDTWRTVAAGVLEGARAGSKRVVVIDKLDGDLDRAPIFEWSKVDGTVTLSRF